MSDINVGDIIWIIDADRHTIIPARIDEQIMSRTIQGEKVYHHIQLPSGKSQKLENLSAAWYSDLAGVRNHLLQRAQEVIESTIKSSVVIAQKKFDFENTDRDTGDLSSESFSSEPGNIPADSVKVSLDNGQVVNVKVPQEFLDESFSH
tara:strand:- start:1259 stop:1705 length:447 start_codon:yes stop_codon:yes gene_type:complete